MRVKWSGASSWMRSAQEGDVEQARMGNSHSTRSQHTVTAHGARSRKNDVESAGPVLCCLGTPSLESGRRYRFSQPIRASFTWVDLLSSGHRPNQLHQRPLVLGRRRQHGRTAGPRGISATDLAACGSDLTGGRVLPPSLRHAATALEAFGAVVKEQG